MKKIKITSDQIVENAEFVLKGIGTVKILSVEKDGYKKGLDRVNTELNGRPYADTVEEIVSFINQN